MLNLQYQHSVEYNRVQCVQIYALYKTMMEYVYVDSDVSSLAKKFPIDVHDSAVSGVACWSH